MLSRILIMTDASEGIRPHARLCQKLRHVGSGPCWSMPWISKMLAAETLKPGFCPSCKRKKSLEQAGFDVSGNPLGVPHREVERLAAEHDISVIVVGSHGHTLMRDIMLGSPPVRCRTPAFGIAGASGNHRK